MSESNRRREANNEKVEMALKLIIDERKPYSTSLLVQQFRLNKHEAISLRRALNRECVQGRIQRVIRCEDNSWAWISGAVSREECAAHAANIYLDIEKAPVLIDTQEFANWLKGHRSNKSDGNSN